jgi:hypothetical protein
MRAEAQRLGDERTQVLSYAGLPMSRRARLFRPDRLAARASSKSLVPASGAENAQCRHPAEP